MELGRTIEMFLIGLKIKLEVAYGISNILSSTSLSK